MIKTNKKGFTLIELMVVIAIIAILATAVLVSLDAARSRAKDTNKISAVTQIRSLAETYYSATLDYSGLSGSSEYQSIKTEYGDVLVVAGDNRAYCAEIELTDGKYFYIDSEFVAETKDGSVCNQDYANNLPKK